MTDPERGERAAVYTSLYGGYDRLIDPVAQDLDVDWICFTDDPSISSAVWKVVVDAPKAATARLSSKWHKAVPHLALPDHRRTIWVDANMAIDSPSFAREVLAHLGGEGITVFRHPHRDCIYDEAVACRRLPRCRDLPVLEQVAAYRAAGHPRHWGLYACGTIARDASNERVRELGEDWYRECERWTPRDQLSFPVVARRHGVVPATFPHHLHRHVGVDSLLCLAHRSSLVERLLVARDAPPTGGGPARPRRPASWLVRRTTGSNPWYGIVDHERAV